MKGTEIRHADVESVSAVSGKGLWLGSTLVKEGANEIPVAREQLAKLDVTGKTPRPLLRCACFAAWWSVSPRLGWRNAAKSIPAAG